MGRTAGTHGHAALSRDTISIGNLEIKYKTLELSYSRAGSSSSFVPSIGRPGGVIPKKCIQLRRQHLEAKIQYQSAMRSGQYWRTVDHFMF